MITSQQNTRMFQILNKLPVVHTEFYKGWKIKIEDEGHGWFAYRCVKGLEVIYDKSSTKQIDLSVIFAKDHIDANVGLTDKLLAKKDQRHYQRVSSLSFQFRCRKLGARCSTLNEMRDAGWYYLYKKYWKERRSINV